MIPCMAPSVHKTSGMDSRTGQLSNGHGGYDGGDEVELTDMILRDHGDAEGWPLLDREMGGGMMDEQHSSSSSTAGGGGGGGGGKKPKSPRRPAGGEAGEKGAGEEEDRQRRAVDCKDPSAKTEWRGTSKEWKRYIRRSLYEVFLGTRLNLLLVFIPVSSVAVQLGFSQGWIFVFALLGIAPLAERLGYVTEQLAQFTGPTAGGLLNATFGNATEIIISIFALREGLVRVVQLSLLGSILSNMLLVLGCAFLFGGLKRKEQRFNKAAALVNSGLLLMAVMGLLLPAVLQSTHTELHEQDSELQLSRFSSCVMLASYCFYLYFQLKSHAHLYNETECTAAAGASSRDGSSAIDDDDDADEEQEQEEEEEDVLGFWGSIFWLAVITIFISLLSEYVVTAIEGASKLWDIPVAFISVIILPIVGNAAEHASAVVFALKDKLDISLGVAIGSSTQISMFAIPFCVVVGWGMGVRMDLNFHLFETATLFITVLVVTVVLQEGTANYFKGIMLVLCYLIVGASFYVHSDSEMMTSAVAVAQSPPA